MSILHRAGGATPSLSVFALPLQPRPYIDAVSGGFLSELRCERSGNRLRHERLERGEFCSLFLTAHRRALAQLIAEGQIAAAT